MNFSSGIPWTLHETFKNPVFLIGAIVLGSFAGCRDCVVTGCAMTALGSLVKFGIVHPILHKIKPMQPGYVLLWGRVARAATAVLGCSLVSVISQAVFNERVALLPALAVVGAMNGDSSSRITDCVLSKLGHSSSNFDWILNRIFLISLAICRADLNQIDLNSRLLDLKETPFEKACSDRDPVSVKFLLEWGAKVNSQAISLGTLINNNPQDMRIFEHFFNHNANPNAFFAFKTSMRRTVLMDHIDDAWLPSKFLGDKMTRLELVFLFTKDHLARDLKASLLLDRGANVTPLLKEYTPFQQFAQSRFNKQQKPFVQELSRLFNEIYLVKKLYNYYSYTV